ncbi:MAG: GtrA family protein [Candidatus Eiseniibacteriota bacterium]
MIGQFGRFVVVGLLATGTHVGVAMALVESGTMGIMTANVVAFMLALAVSYVGNHRWTFAADGDHGRRLPRFVTLALIGFAANQLIVAAIVTLAGWDYRIALAVVVLVMPGLSFVANRRWVFRSQLLSTARESTS